MAFSQDGDRIAGPAAADFSAQGAGQYRAARRNADDTIGLCGANAADFAGVLQDCPKAGQTATVKTAHTTKAVAGAAFARSVFLTTDSAGRFVLATTGQRVLARSEAAATALGDIVAIRLRPGLELAP